METNIPKLRFPEFKDEWEIMRLGNIAEVSSGGTPSRANSLFWNGDIPWVSTSLIDFNTIKETEEYITFEGLNNSSAKVFPAGTLLMAMYGQGKTRGKISLLGIDASTNQACGAIMPNKSILLNTFLFQNIAKRYDEIRDLSNQGGQENLSGGIIKDIKVCIPTLAEQQKIASFLSEIDERLQALKKKKSLLEQYKKGVMQKIFSQELRFKDENGNNFTDWEEKTLGEVGDFQTSSIDKLSIDGQQEVTLINYMNVYRHEIINNESIKYYQHVTAKSTQILSCNLKKGDILFTPSSETPTDIGHSVVIFEDLENCVYSYHLMRFRPKIEIDILFSHFFCNNSKVLSQLSKLSTGSTRFTISVSSFSSVIIDLPCLAEQSKIANFLSAIDDKISLVAKALEATQQYKKGLLQQMFC